MIKILIAMVLMLGLASLDANETAKDQAPEPVAGCAENAEWLQQHLERDVAIRGVVSNQSSIAKAGHFFYQFDRSELKLFCFKGAAVTIPEEKHPSSLVGKTIEVRGKLALYKDKPQIVIRKPEQIQIVAAAEEPKPEVEKSDQSEKK